MSRPGQSLTDALLKMAGNGQRPRCGDWNDNNPWLSDDERLRAMAARWCAGCPVLAECGAAADETPERFGVWAGRDRTKRERKAAAPQTRPIRKDSE